MKFILGFLFALFIMSVSPTTIAYMVQYLNSLHQVVEDKVIDELEKMPVPQKPSKWEST
jgi:hypothetical protein